MKNIRTQKFWIPAFAGMTLLAFWVPAFSGMTLPGEQARSLKETLEKALKESPYLKLQQKNVNAKRGDVQVAWSPFFPHLQGELGKGFQSKDNYFTKLQKQKFDNTGNVALMSVNTDLEQNIAYWNVTTKQDLFKGFGNYHNLKEKKKLLEMADIDLITEKNNIIYTVMDTYIEILNLENSLDFLSKAKSSAQEQARNLEKRFEVQTVQKSDVEKAEEKFLELDWRELEAKQALEIAQYKLNQLLGEPIATPFKASAIHIKNLSIEPLHFYLERLPQNLDLTRIEIEVKKDRYKRRGTYAQNLGMPNVGFEFNYEQRGWKFTDLQEAWKLGVVVRAPLFDGLENFGEQSKAQAQLEATQLKSHLTQESTEIDIKKNFYSFQALQKNAQYLKKKWEREQRLYDQTRKALKQSAATLAQLHAQEVMVLETEHLLFKNKRQQLLNVISLQKLIGEIHYDNLF